MHDVASSADILFDATETRLSQRIAEREDPVWMDWLDGLERRQAA